MTTPLERIAAAITELLHGWTPYIDAGVTTFEALLADDVVWGECVGPADVMASLRAAGDDWSSIEVQNVSVHADRVHVRMVGVFDDERIEINNVMFERDGLISEIRDPLNAADALNIAPLTSLDGNRPSVIEQIIPLLPVADLTAAVRDYELLGFIRTSSLDGDEVTMTLGPAAITLASDEEARMARGAVHLIVDDVTGFFAHWHASGASGELVVPLDDGVNQPVGSYLDRDENLIRFSEPVRSTSRTP